MIKELLTPDVRFGTSFLDVSKSDIAVRGEVLMDKTTGEIFIKRVIDGKVISFTQQDTNMLDMMNKLNVLLQNNTLFRAPIFTSGLFVDAVFKINDIMGGDTNILLEDIEFRRAINPDNNIILDIDCDTNGFFYEPLTRENDRNIVSYLNIQYNLRETSGHLVRPDVYQKIEGWENNNMLLTYEITTEGLDINGNVVNPIVLTETVAVRINDYGSVIFPENYKAGMDTVTKITVRIVSFRFPKLQAAYSVFMEDPDQIPFSNLIEPDYAAFIRNFHVMYFIEDDKNVPSGDTVYINQLIDLRFLNDFLNKVQKVNSSNGMILSEQRPADTKWTIDNAWAEAINDLQGAEVVNKLNSPTNVYDLEKYLYTLLPFITRFTFDPNDEIGMLIEVIPEEEVL